MFKTVLFDLDGTITDSAVGIVNCVIYALNALKICVPERKKLECFIGPPLKEEFKKSFGLSDEKADFAVKKYRERYNNKGIYENKLYDNIDTVLHKLKDSEVKICLATSKPQIYAEKILEYFNIREYFSIVAGSELNGKRTKKSEVINAVIAELSDEKDEIIMVGDRKYDVEAAHECGIKCIGAKYGYPEKNELENAKADYIVASVEELIELLLKITKNSYLQNK